MFGKKREVSDHVLSIIEGVECGVTRPGIPEPTLKKCPYCEGYLPGARFFNTVECIHCGRRWKDKGEEK